MEGNGIHTVDGRKEITCSDCGHLYLVGLSQRSSVCQACGNIEYFGVSPAQVKELTENIVAKRVLPRLREEPKPDPLAAFQKMPDGLEVEDLRTRYQVEWQLWAALVKHFENPAYHAAFLSSAIATNRLEQASEFYREHRSVMTLLADSRWQADVADLMLSRIEAISISRMAHYKGWYEFDIPTWLKLLPYDSRLVRISWIAIGLFLAAKFIHLPRI